MNQQFRLPDWFLDVLRGNASYVGEWKEIAEAGRIYYLDGWDGIPFDHTATPPTIAKKVVELIDRFLMACWEQGQIDRANAPEGGVLH